MELECLGLTSLRCLLAEWVDTWSSAVWCRGDMTPEVGVVDNSNGSSRCFRRATEIWGQVLK
jgi:hypothetical protein